jgi:hypothetical protein
MWTDIGLDVAKTLTILTVLGLVWFMFTLKLETPKATMEMVAEAEAELPCLEG